MSGVYNCIECHRAVYARMQYCSLVARKESESCCHEAFACLAVKCFCALIDCISMEQHSSIKRD